MMENTLMHWKYLKRYHHHHHDHHHLFEDELAHGDLSIGTR